MQGIGARVETGRYSKCWADVELRGAGNWGKGGTWQVLQSWADVELRGAGNWGKGGNWQVLQSWADVGQRSKCREWWRDGRKQVLQMQGGERYRELGQGWKQAGTPKSGLMGR